MLDRLFPDRVDNDYRGHWLALWAFIPITLVTGIRSLIHIFAPDGGAQSIATIPLDAMTPLGSQGVITIFALWGLSQLLLGLVYVVVIWRYRTLLPLMYALLILEYAGRLAIFIAKPIVTQQTPPGASANFLFIAIGSVMLLLSMRATPNHKSAV